MYTESSGCGQPSPECPTNIPIVVPMPPINATFPCCPGCEVLNEPVTKLVPIEEDYPIMLPHNNQGQCYVQIPKESGHSWGVEVESGSGSSGSYRLPVVTGSQLGCK